MSETQTNSKSNQSILLLVGLTRYFVTVAERWTDTRNGGLDGRQLLWLPHLAISKSLEMTWGRNLGKIGGKKLKKCFQFCKKSMRGGSMENPQDQNADRILSDCSWGLDGREDTLGWETVCHILQVTRLCVPLWPDTLWDATFKDRRLITFKARRLICWKTLWDSRCVDWGGYRLMFSSGFMLRIRRERQSRRDWPAWSLDF